ncbi:nucleoside triphosphate pyrophosphohydrolase [Oscillospiraceae bacterium LTW-04]|nr:nucleoside triphosphate pyrophosphohydrolase [Oscillospiraceae bacterium MB24-C1]
MAFELKENYQVSDLIRIMSLLRDKDGCPWDLEQTHESIRKNLIEEAYEVVEAIDANDSKMLCEELGDLLLQVVFHSRISEETGDFSIDNVADGICKKLILRHPHIFGDAVVNNSKQVLENWDEIKKREKGQTTVSDTLHSVPNVLPALMRSQKVQKRAAKSGFDYPDAAMALADLESEIVELKVAMAKQDDQSCYEELGDVLFSAVNVARMLDIDAEEGLTASCNKFIRRFDAVEQLAERENVDLKHAPLDRLNKLWRDVKNAQSK